MAISKSRTSRTSRTRSFDARHYGADDGSFLQLFSMFPVFISQKKLKYHVGNE